MKIHLGAYGVLKSNSKILMIKKGRGPYTGLLDLPGGRIEPEENIEEALARELQEETGLTVSMHRLIGVYQSFSDELNLIGLYYLLEQTSGTIKEGPDGFDSNGAVWVEINTLTEENVTPNAMKAIKKAEELF